MRLSTVFSAGIGCAVLVSAFAACSTSPRTIGQLVDDPPPLLTNDAGEDASFVGLTQYCPTDKCPDGYTTCPGSRFRCDVNLQTDRENCGECGNACPVGDRTKGEVVECVAGRCVMNCNPRSGLDCDGIVDNGCETLPYDQQNCGECGNACTDPDKPCVPNPQTQAYQCGCVVGEIACRQEVLGVVSYVCVRPDDDDRNCGACGNLCPSNPDGGPLAANTYHGCRNNTCGHLKCAINFGDCDGDPANGCESPLNTNDHCGTCDPCGPGQECRLNKDNAYECMCPPGLTYCFRECVDLSSDPRNCGACGVTCNSFSDYSVGVCTHGICSRECVTGRADCNRNPADECEVNINSDPQNCGGCGIVCDAVAGQACAGGRCTVEPCPESDAGPVAR